MQRFLSANRRHLAGGDYAALHAWSVESPAEFWEAVWKFCGVRAETPYTAVARDLGHMPGTRWFEGCTLNFAANLLAPARSGSAIVFANEREDRFELSWDELRAQVASVAAALRSFGVGKGDRVAAFIANRPEAIVAMLATASLGAVWSSCSPDFGVDAVLDRFGQIEPKVLFATDGYFYSGKSIDSLPAVRAIAARLPTLEAVVVVPYREPAPDISGISGAVSYRDLLRSTAELVFTQVGFQDPVYILYSSGTTGVPKCIVHSVGGTLLQHRKEHVLHTDIAAGDVVFYFTTTGWMMWHWLVSALATGATLVLYDGAPLHPDPGVLWRDRKSTRLNSSHT